MPIEVEPQKETAAPPVQDRTDLLSHQQPAGAASMTTAAFPEEQHRPDRSQSQKPLKPTRPKQKSPRSIDAWNGSALMYWIFEFLLGIAMIFIAAVLWRQDGRYTIRFIESQFAGFNDAAVWQQWIIPVFFTIGFLGAYPRNVLRVKRDTALEIWRKTQQDDDLDLYYALRKTIRIRWAVAIIIQTVNIATSFSGLILSIAGKSYEFFVPITFPTEGIGLLIPTFLFAGILAFGPEIMARWAVPFLWNLLKRAWTVVTHGVPTRVKA